MTKFENLFLFNIMLSFFNFKLLESSSKNKLDIDYNLDASKHIWWKLREESTKQGPVWVEMLGEPVEGRTKYNMAKRRAHKLKQELGHGASMSTASGLSE